MDEVRLAQTVNDLPVTERQWRRAWAASRLGAAVMLLLFVGCGEGIRDGERPGDLERRSGALRCYDSNGNPSNDPDCPWRYWSRLQPLNPNSDITHTRAPAHCGTPAGFLTVTVDTSSRYRTLQWSALSKAPNWATYGTRTFASKPACALRETAAPGQPGIVLAGKGTDNRIYASPGTMAPLNDPQANPVGASFAAVSNTTYSTGGNPGMASDGFAVALVFMGTDNRTIHAHLRQLPYTQNGWSMRITGPALPSGWTAVGSPSVAMAFWVFRILVHARNGSQDRLFEIHLVNSGNQSYFSTETGEPGQWRQLPVTGVIHDDPALLYSTNWGHQVYFRSGAQILQTTGSYPLGDIPPLPVMPSAGVQFASAPAGSADYSFDQGMNIVVARTTANQLFFAESWNDNNPPVPWSWIAP
jgi:hypothetical protein